METVSTQTRPTQRLINAPTLWRHDIGTAYPNIFEHSGATLYNGDFLDASEDWPSPTVIVSDGPYGVGSFPGDPSSPNDLSEWYAPHIARWSERALPSTTLWFWNTEIGWANVHPVLVQNGWSYRSCNVWDKGIGHIAGNANSKTLRSYPIVTEVCVQYVRDVKVDVSGVPMNLKGWLRFEWERSGIPLYKANEACGVKNAATRKYLTKCDMWYFPPPEAFEAMALYANLHGAPAGRPYFSLDRDQPLSADQWAHMRAKFHCDVGITNVWQEPPVRGKERLKDAHKCLHMNQKPLRLLERTILASSDRGDVVWEPFGGLCSVAIAAVNTRRSSYSAELLEDYFSLAIDRLASHALA